MESHWERAYFMMNCSSEDDNNSSLAATIVCNSATEAVVPTESTVGGDV